jgi:hypothetical protein
MTAGRVGAVRGDRDEADVTPALAVGLVIRADGQQAGVLALAAGVGLQRDRIEAGDLAQPAFQFLEQLLVALRPAPAARTGCMWAKSGQLIGIISVVALSFMVHEPSGIIDGQSAMSLACSWRR